jgi:hypothetical protein
VTIKILKNEYNERILHRQNMVKINEVFTNLAMFRMVAAQGDELLANRTIALCLSLADLGVCDDSLHLLARGQAAVGVAALARVHQRLDAPLDRKLAGFLRVRLLHIARGRAHVDIQAQLLHLVRMTFLLVALNAQIEVVAHSTVVTGLYMGLAAVARVHELVRALVV